jgi:hypothetical protein
MLQMMGKKNNMKKRNFTIFTSEKCLPSRFVTIVFVIPKRCVLAMIARARSLLASLATNIPLFRINAPK